MWPSAGQRGRLMTRHEPLFGIYSSTDRNPSATIHPSCQRGLTQHVMPFAVLKLEPWRLRVFPGTVLMGQGGEVLNWRK